MQKKLTITIDEEVYKGLYRVVGTGKISQFIERLVRPHVMDAELEAAYAHMSLDEERERLAEEWIQDDDAETC